MKLYIVFVTFRVPGVAGSNYAVRYVDSQWADKQHAKDRKAELDDSLKMGKAPDHFIEILEGVVPDVAIQSPANHQERQDSGIQGEETKL